MIMAVMPQPQQFIPRIQNKQDYLAMWYKINLDVIKISMYGKVQQQCVNTVKFLLTE